MTQKKKNYVKKKENTNCYEKKTHLLLRIM